MTTLITVPSEFPARQARGVYAPTTLVDGGQRNLREWLGVILRRGWIALLAGGVAFALVLAYAAQMPKAYTADGSLVVEPRRPNLAAPDQNQGVLPADTGSIDTQVEVLRSRALAQAVVHKLQLYRDPEFNAGADELRGPPDAATINRIVEAVQGRTTIYRAGLTYVIHVRFTAASPEKAARVVNALIQTYLDRQLDEKLAAVTRANRELGGSVELLRQQAEVAEARAQEYRIANNLYSAEGATMAEQEVSTLNQQIAQARADYAEKQARLNTALAQLRTGGQGQDVGAALGSDTVRELRKREAETAAKLAQLKADFKPGYPEVRRTEAELTELRSQLQLEINRILSSLRAEATAAGQRQGSLLASRGAAQGGLIANNRAQVGLLALEQRAQAAKLIYEGYLKRAQEVAVEGSLQQPDARVSSLAAPPLSPSSPNMRLAILAAAFLGLLAAAAAILVAELWDRTLRSSADVQRHLGLGLAGIVPDVASLPHSPRGSSAQDYLLSNPYSAFSEAFRNIRAHLLLTGARGPATIAITSPLPREGKSITSVCLARTLALSGARVVLVDCDLRQQGVSRLVQRDGSGLVQVVFQGLPLDEALIDDPKSDAKILVTGANGAIPFDVFSRPEFDEALNELKRRFDIVVLDTPPIIGVADARVIAAKADRVLYLVRWNRTPIRTAQAGLAVLAGCGARLAGVLLGQVDVRRQARNGFQDSSDYYGQYGAYYAMGRPPAPI
jgi:capsular exopolysaccharide synthesis family protein